MPSPVSAGKMDTAGKEAKQIHLQMGGGARVVGLMNGPTGKRSKT